MSLFDAQVKVIEGFWVAIFGRNPTGQCCIAMSVVLLSGLYAIALLWLVPWAVYRALRYSSVVA